MPVSGTYGAVVIPPEGSSIAQTAVTLSQIGADMGWGAGGAAWGSITGTLSSQADLQSALDAKLASNGNGSGLTGLTKAQVGLANADNTSDASKPISTATQAALDGKQAALVSGTNIKTVNGSSLLGAGNLAIGGPTVAFKPSDQTAIGTAFADVTGTGLSVAANTSYAFEFHLICDSDAATTGIDVSCNGPAIGTGTINYTVTYWTSATAQAFRPYSVYDGNTASTGSNGATRALFKVEGILRNGANAGTLIARAKRENVGTGPNVRAGSFGRLWQIS